MEHGFSEIDVDGEKQTKESNSRNCFLKNGVENN
jgi:hypothetical protein